MWDNVTPCPECAIVILVRTLVRKVPRKASVPRLLEDKDNYSPYIHTLEDIIGISVNSFEQSERFTQMNIACVATLANLSTESVAENKYDYVTMFPNPAKNTLTLASEMEGIQEVQIVNSLGQIVKEFSFETSLTIDVKDLNNGIYFVKILSDNPVTKKIVVKN